MTIDFKTYFSLSFMSVAALVIYAYYTREQFYPTILFLVSSKLSFLISGNMLLVTVVLVAKILKTIFFGKLRGVEVELLFDKAKYSITETCLALTVFRHEITPTILMIFGSLIVVKAFHWLAKSRIEYNEQQQHLPLKSHLRMISLITSLVIIDVAVARYCIKYTFDQGRSVFILFGFEFGLLVIYIFSMLFRYILQCIDEAMESEFQSKGFYLMLCELIADALKLVTYTCFFCLVFVYYGLPIHIIREVWISFVNFQMKMASFIKYLQLNHNLDQRFDDATPEDLTAAAECLICREPMAAGKKLPCSHIFHLTCLRGWLQHQQSCPLCRSDIPVTAARRAGAQLRAARAEQRVENVVAPQQVNDLVPPVDDAVAVVGDVDIDISENILRSEPSLSSVEAKSEQSHENAVIAERISPNMTAFVEQFPSFFQVKNGHSCRIYVSPDETSRSVRNLTSGVVVFATERRITDDGFHWLRLVDGFILERRPEGLTFDAEVFLEVFNKSLDQISGIKVASSSSKSKSMTSSHKRLLPKSTAEVAINILRRKKGSLGLGRGSANVLGDEEENNPLLKKLAKLEDNMFVMSTQLMRITEGILKTREAIQEIRQEYNQSIGNRINRESGGISSGLVTPTCAISKNGDDETLATIDGGAAATNHPVDNFSTSQEKFDSQGGGSVRQLREKYFQTKVAGEAHDS